jgi:endonuclease/exonuclease/phosphatase family metal-dependent hydrolase
MPATKSLLFFLFLIVFCGGFFALLYANRNYHRPPPPSALWSPPDKPIRFVSYNVRQNRAGIDKVLDEIRRLEPDIVFLQEIEKTQLSQMTDALHTLPAIYHASENLAGSHARWGNAILSRHPLYDFSTISSGGGGSFGVWATAVVGDAKFKIANVHLAPAGNEMAGLVQAWQDAGAPPIIVGGAFNHGPTAHPWTDALKTQVEDDTTFLVSKEWKPIDGGAAASDASDQKPVWLLVGK